MGFKKEIQIAMFKHASEFVLSSMKDVLEEEGCRVVATATTVPAALEILNKFCEGGEVRRKKGFLGRERDVLDAFVVGKIFPKNGDGEQLVEGIRERCGHEVLIIGASTEGFIEGVSTNVDISNGYGGLAETIKRQVRSKRR